MTVEAKQDTGEGGEEEEEEEERRILLDHTVMSNMAPARIYQIFWNV